MEGVAAGRLGERVQIQAVTKTRQADGTYAETWATYATVWAEIEPIPQDERVEADTVRTARQYKVTIRYLADLTEADRVLRGGVTALDILSATLPGRKKLVWELTCMEHVT